MRISSGLLVTAALVVTLAGCGGSDTEPTDDTGIGQAESGQATTEAGVYQDGASASSEFTTLTVDKVTDHADATAPWGAPNPNDSHYVVIDVTLTVVAGRGGALTPTCFTAIDSEGEEAKNWVGMTADGGTPLGGMLTPGTPSSGQLVYEVKEDRQVKSLTGTCGELGQDSVTVDIS